jgi:thioredoxin:protein disulfide reductase
MPRMRLTLILLLLAHPVGAGGGTLLPEAGLDVAESAGGMSNPLTALTNLFGNSPDDEKFLPPDEAFRLTADVRNTNTLVARWQIAEGYYLYRDKMRFALNGAHGVSLGKAALPAGVVEEDEFFGRVEIYPQDIEANLPLERTTAGAQSVRLEVQYQGCAKAGICYPPITKQVSLELPAGEGASTAAVTMVSDAQTPGDSLASNVHGNEEPLRSVQDQIADQLSAGGLWLNIAFFFSAGLLLAFTPCVFPMIPILSGVIAGQGAKIETRRAFSLSATFVLAMAVAYTAAGVIVGLSGENVQVLLQNPWVIAIFAGVFVALALSMFGFYDLQMPSAVQTRLSAVSGRRESGTFIGAGIMGVLSALIVGPCVTAPLIGALLYIAHTGDALLGGAALFSLSLGMGAPLLVIGTSLGKFIPRVGGWMAVIKGIFGVLLLGVAVWLLARILPASLTMVLWALLLIVSSIYMGAFDAVCGGASNWLRLRKGLGLAMSVYGAVLLVGAAAGGHDPLRPLKGVLATDAARDSGLDFKPIKGVDGLRRAIADARAQNKPVMLDFYADWCVSCKEMEKYTFNDPSVQATLRGAILLQADVTGNDARDRALLKSLGLFGPPAILFYTPAGREQPAARVVGFMSADEFGRHVRRVLAVESS